MSLLQWWIVVFAAVVGHFGMHISLYNRINGFGWPRRLIKTIVKFFFLTTWIVPAVVLYVDGGSLLGLLGGGQESLSMGTQAYGMVCLLSWLLLGIPWLLWRPLFGLEWLTVARQVEIIDVPQALGRPLARSSKCQWESRLPFNQIFDLAIEQVELPVSGLPQSLDGYRIAHLTDIHLTGDVQPDYAKYAVDRATQWQPDLMALTGDIVDTQLCVDWLGDVFADAQASDGCYFLLGNHDKRLVDPLQTRHAMQQAGWIDLGGRTHRTKLRDQSCLMLGNEHPWFERPIVDGGDTVDEFRLLLSHSPDQLAWARRHGVTLMLAGHTHGGQGRLPLAGPILSPSFHGSRYASGDFYKPPTTMHVSRGLGGVHLLRIRCRPELSLLTLRVA